MSEFQPIRGETNDSSKVHELLDARNIAQNNRVQFLNNIIRGSRPGTIVSDNDGKTDDILFRKEVGGKFKGVDGMKDNGKVTILEAAYKKDPLDGTDHLYYKCKVNNSDTKSGGKKGTDTGWIYAGYVKMDIPTPAVGSFTPMPLEVPVIDFTQKDTGNKLPGEFLRPKEKTTTDGATTELNKKNKQKTTKPTPSAYVSEGWNYFGLDNPGDVMFSKDSAEDVLTSNEMKEKEEAKREKLKPFSEKLNLLARVINAYGETLLAKENIEDYREKTKGGMTGRERVMNHMNGLSNELTRIQTGIMEGTIKELDIKNFLEALKHIDNDFDSTAIGNDIDILISQLQNMPNSGITAEQEGALWDNFRRSFIFSEGNSEIAQKYALDAFFNDDSYRVFGEKKEKNNKLETVVSQINAFPEKVAKQVFEKGNTNFDTLIDGLIREIDTDSDHAMMILQVDVDNLKKNLKLIKANIDENIDTIMTSWKKDYLELNKKEPTIDEINTARQQYINGTMLNSAYEGIKIIAMKAFIDRNELDDQNALANIVDSSTDDKTWRLVQQVTLDVGLCAVSGGALGLIARAGRFATLLNTSRVARSAYGIAGGATIGAELGIVHNLIEDRDITLDGVAKEAAIGALFGGISQVLGSVIRSAGSLGPNWLRSATMPQLRQAMQVASGTPLAAGWRNLLTQAVQNKGITALWATKEGAQVYATLHLMEKFHPLLTGHPELEGVTFEEWVVAMAMHTSLKALHVKNGGKMTQEEINTIRDRSLNPRIKNLFDKMVFWGKKGPKPEIKPENPQEILRLENGKPVFRLMNEFGQEGSYLKLMENSRHPEVVKAKLEKTLQGWDKPTLEKYIKIVEGNIKRLEGMKNTTPEQKTKDSWEIERHQEKLDIAQKILLEKGSHINGLRETLIKSNAESVQKYEKNVKDDIALQEKILKGKDSTPEQKANAEKELAKLHEELQIVQEVKVQQIKAENTRIEEIKRTTKPNIDSRGNTIQKSWLIDGVLHVEVTQTGFANGKPQTFSGTCEGNVYIGTLSRNDGRVLKGKFKIGENGNGAKHLDFHRAEAPTQKKNQDTRSDITPDEAARDLANKQALDTQRLREAQDFKIVQARLLELASDSKVPFEGTPTEVAALAKKYGVEVTSQEPTVNDAARVAEKIIKERRKNDPEYAKEEYWKDLGEIQEAKVIIRSGLKVEIERVKGLLEKSRDADTTTLQEELRILEEKFDAVDSEIFRISHE